MTLSLIIPIPAGVTLNVDHFNAKLYLMFLAPGDACPVPLVRQKWKWEGAAELKSTGVWDWLYATSVSNVSKTGGPDTPVFHPEWTKVIPK